MRRIALLARLVARIAGPAFVVAALPPWLVLAFVVAETYRIVDWPAIAHATSSWSAGASALLVGVALAAWASSWRRPLAGALDHPGLAVLWRQPLGDGAWGVALAPFLALSGLPFALGAWFASSATAGGAPPLPIEMIAFFTLWPPVAVGAARGRWGPIVPAFALLLAGRAAPALWWPLAVAAPASVVLAARWGRERLVDAAPSAVPGRPRTPLGAVLRHDFACLWRLEREAVLACLAPAPLVGLVAWGLREDADVAAVGSLALLGLFAPATAGRPLARLAERLGTRLDPPSWPIPAALRVAALLIVGLLASAPASAAAIGAAPSASLAARVAALGLALAGGGVLLATRPPRDGRRRVNLGVYAWWALVSTVVAWLPPPVGPFLDIILGALGTSVAVRALERQRGTPWVT